MSQATVEDVKNAVTNLENAITAKLEEEPEAPNYPLTDDELQQIVNRINTQTERVGSICANDDEESIPVPEEEPIAAGRG